jgi:hypothetical protein
MGILDDIRDAVVGVVQKALNVVTDVSAGILAVLGQIGQDLATFSEFFRNGLERTLSQVVPKDVARFVTLGWYLIEIGDRFVAGFLQNYAEAVRTGKFFDAVNLMKIGAVAAMRAGREEARKASRPLTVAMLALIPDERDRMAIADMTYTVLPRIEDRKFVEVWSWFVDHDTAITLIDVIVFRKEPNLKLKQDRHLVVHEIKHLLQFKDKGVENFISDYIDDFINDRRIEGKLVGRLEEAADLYACSIVKGAAPHYIPRCPH